MNQHPCSLHPMARDVLRRVVGALAGDGAVDWRGDAQRAARHELLLNWTARLRRTTAEVLEGATAERRAMVGRLRPYFITAEDAEGAAEETSALLGMESFDGLLEMWHVQLGRLDEVRAGTLLDAARRMDEAEARGGRTLEERAAGLAAYVGRTARDVWALSGEGEEARARGARLLGYRVCGLLAGLLPAWRTGPVSLSALVAASGGRLAPLLADPRAMFAPVDAKAPGLSAAMPLRLGDGRQAGLCVAAAGLGGVREAARAVGRAEGAGFPAVGLQALSEALAFGERAKTAVWECAGLLGVDGAPPEAIDEGAAERADVGLDVAAEAGALDMEVEGDGRSLLERQQAYVRKLLSEKPVVPPEGE